MFGLIGLGFVLGLDNFRTSLVLGALKPTFRQSLKTSAIFGLWDGVAPLVGLLIGEVIGENLDETAETIAMIGLGVYGVFLVIRSLVSPERADPDLKWARWGLPIPLSVDNVAGGAALGIAGYSPWLAPILFGVMTFVMSLAGHQLGSVVVRFISWIPKINTDMLVGACFAVMAILMAFGVTLPLSYD
ncbi:hypothetical protein GCM10022222_85920 [Amycolatopsis ultiminotia]|uniref:Mn2+ efflux pump MntP n=1 Tax=Amycolatopsis ultiminotia TaxID=543629 RepID=A0ABP6YRW3_9PSEU